MAREIKNPRLKSGGINYTRAEHRIASLKTLLEQEEKSFANSRWKDHKAEAICFNGISCSESKGSGAIARNKHYPIKTRETLF